MVDTVMRIEQLYRTALDCLEQRRFYDAFVCMLEREKQISLLVDENIREIETLETIRIHTEDIERILHAEIARHKLAIANLTLHAPAHMAYARAATQR